MLNLGEENEFFTAHLKKIYTSQEIPFFLVTPYKNIRNEST
jgi:hypothetical protein